METGLAVSQTVSHSTANDNQSPLRQLGRLTSEYYWELYGRGGMMSDDALALAVEFQRQVVEKMGA